MNYAANLDGNLAAESAHQNAMADAEVAHEIAVAAYGDAARAELREDACTDTDCIHDVLVTLSPSTLEQATRAALTGDHAEIGRLLGPALARYVTDRESETVEIERVSMRMWKEGA